MSSYITSPPHLNRITDMPASKFNLSVVTHSKTRLFEGQEQGRGDRSILSERQGSHISQMLLL